MNLWSFKARSFVMLAIFFASVGIVGTSTLLPAAGEVKPLSEPNTEDEAELSRVASIMLSMPSKLESDFPEAFGGMYQLTDEITVIRVVDIESPAAQAMIEFVRDLMKESEARVGRTVDYRFETYPVTFQRVRSALDRVLEVMRSTGSGIVSAGIGRDGLVVGIESETNLPKLHDIFDREIPDVSVDLRIEPSPGLTADRYSDSSPWNGGDMLAISVGGAATFQCTSGPGAHDALGNRYLLMAAHCGMTYFFNTNFGSPSLNSPVGPMSARIYSNYYPDAGVISTNSSQYFWAGPGAGVRRTTLAAVDPVVGMQVCGQGVTTAAFGATNCGTVALIDSCELFRDVGLTFCGLFRWDGSASLGGDSGGYISYSSIYGFGAVGTITGSNTAGIGQSFGTPVSFHRFYWGLTLNTPSTP